MQQNLLNRLTKLLLVSRPVFWPVVPVAFLWGVVSSGGDIDVSIIALAVAFSFPFCFFMFGINDVYDYEGDLKRDRSGVLLGTSEPDSSLHSVIKYISAMVVVLMILLSFWAAGIVGALLMSTFLVVTFFYSAPPLRFKVNAPLDATAHFAILLPYAIGLACAGQLSALPVNAIWAAAVFVGIYIITSVVDYESDRDSKFRTVAVWIGQQGAVMLGSSLILLCGIIADFSMELINWILIGTGLLGLLIGVVKKLVRNYVTHYSIILYIAILCVALAMFMSKV